MLRTLWGSASEAALGRSAPLPARPRGGPTFFEESRRKEHQGSALDPGFMAARSHSLGLGMVASGPFEVLFPPVY